MTGHDRPTGALCRVEELEATGAKGIEPPTAGLAESMFVVQAGDGIRGYVNACPHAALPLEWQPDRFLTSDRALILCGTHGAFFRPEDGYCVKGPCHGRSLEPVTVAIVDGWVCLR